MGIDLSSGAPSAQFEKPGDSVAGTIVRVEELQQTDMETGEPQFWDAAKQRPKMMISVTLHSPDHPDADEESGEVCVYLSGGRYAAVKAVTRRLDEGGQLRLTFVGLSDQPPKQKGYNRAKRFEAVYQAPKSSASFDDDETGPRVAQRAARPAGARRSVPDDEIPF